MFKGFYKWIVGRIKYRQTKRWMDDRATSTAVKLVITGALRTRA